MFYPIHLLTHRRKGKLAACWFAGTINEKLFKRYYSSVAIKKINVIVTCEEILQTIQLHNKKTQKFSLYLSSQLMCGVTRIHFYQTIYYQKEVFEIQQKLWKHFDFDSDSDSAGNFNLSPDPNLPPIFELPYQDFLDAQLGENLYTIPGEVSDSKLQMIMQDVTCLDFGALTDEELEFMLEHNGYTPFDLKEQRQVTDCRRVEDVTEMMADIEIVEEVHRESLSGVFQSPMFVDISKRKDKSKEELPLTPQKRQQRQQQVETPTKRRRLSLESTAITVPPALPIEEIREPILPQEVKLSMELESLHSSFFVIKKHPKSKIIDKKIFLENELFRHQDAKAHCRQLVIPVIHRTIPAIELLNQPSLWFTRWNAYLHDLFVNHITGPFTSANEDITSAKFMQSQETMMRFGETTSKLDFPTKELSTLGKTHIATTIESFALDHTPNILPMIPMTDIIHETREASMIAEMLSDMIILEKGINDTDRVWDPKKPDMNDTNETSLEDIDILLKWQQRSSRTEDRIPNSSTPSTSTSQVPDLTSHEILALLNVLWCNRDYVKLSELVPKDTYSKADAATVFNILLELHARNKLILQQSICYRTLWIRKTDFNNDSINTTKA